MRSEFEASGEHGQRKAKREAVRYHCLLSSFKIRDRWDHFGRSIVKPFSQPWMLSCESRVPNFEDCSSRVRVDTNHESQQFPEFFATMRGDVELTV